MCIYCNTNNYRNIYENHHGIIPQEENGRSYHIHHIDGNRMNNDPANLIALSIQEHYNIHHLQNDWYACLKLAKQMNKSPEEISELARKEANRRIENGNHHFTDSEWQRQNQLKIIKNGKHFFVNDNPAKLEKNKKYGDDNVTRRPEVKEKLSGNNHYMNSPTYNPMSHNSKNPETVAKRSGKNHWMSRDNPNYSPDKSPSFNSNIYKFVNEKLGMVEETTFYGLRTKYNLNSGNLSRLINGKSNSYLGWKLADF
jgi:hypothetical protein